MCVGNVGSVPRLGLHKNLCLQDSPLGIRFADWASAFPAGLTAAATFDRDLMYQRGRAMGEEHRGKGIDIQLGPVAGPIGRAPTGGRNWEGFSPDPVLTGVGMAETIKGIQDAGVIACAKHYIANEQGKSCPWPHNYNGGTPSYAQNRAFPSIRRSTGLRLQHH